MAGVWLEASADARAERVRAASAAALGGEMWVGSLTLRELQDIAALPVHFGAEMGYRIQSSSPGAIGPSDGPPQHVGVMPPR